MSENKKYTPQEVAEELRKSLYKMVKKTMENMKAKVDAKEVVEDILDPNFVAEIEDEEVPEEKDNVLWKGKKKNKNLKKFIEKRQKKRDK